jgi:tetratricopeptide (TPR) repeat protein
MVLPNHRALRVAVLAMSLGGLVWSVGLTASGAQAKGRDKPATAKPKSIAQKTRILGELYERLAASDSEQSAEVLASTIEQVWLYSGSATVDVLMERSLKASNEKKSELALQLLDGVVALLPQYAEGWNRRAYVHFVRKDYGAALADLRRVLAIDPRHFKALNGLATIMLELGHKAPALQAYRKLLDIHPYLPEAKQAVRELEREVEGSEI